MAIKTNPDYSDNTYYQPFSSVHSLPFTKVAQVDPMYIHSNLGI